MEEKKCNVDICPFYGNGSKDEVGTRCLTCCSFYKSPQSKIQYLEQQLQLKDKMIELMANRIWAMQISSTGIEYKKSDVIKDYTEQALVELRGE